jgi:ribosomal protein L7/L12
LASKHPYFQSFENYFWQWEERGEVIAVPGGATIIYTQQLGEIIDNLLTQGLPSLGALLLALTATNPNDLNALEGIDRISPLSQDKMYIPAREFLKLLTELPPAFKKGPKRMQLLQMLFKNGHRLHSQKDSKDIYAQWRAGIQAGDPVFQKQPMAAYQYDTDFRTLALLNNQFKTVNQIIDCIAGVPDPQQVPIEFEEALPLVPDAPAATDFVGELIEHYQTFAVGSLVRWLWSGLNIPAHSALPSQQPLGGVSDLTNKGSYDKLLISEFANDDLVFLSRLANNEALYLQRETPPASHTLHRVVLVDATLKNWGTPKTLAFAVAVAIARHPKTDIECKAYVVDGNTYHPVSLDSKESIIDGLQIVKGGLHAGGGLEAFFKDNGNSRNLELFFITEPTTLRQGGLLRVLNEHHQQIQYLIHTEADGSIDIYKKQGSTKKHLQHLRLPLDKLWEKPPRNKNGGKNQNGKFHVDYPLLLRGGNKADKLLMSAGGDIFLITGGKSVMRLFDKNKPKARGWDLVCNQLPFTPNFWEVGLTPEGHYVMLAFNSNTREIVLIHLQNGEKINVQFGQWRAGSKPHFVFDGEQFIHQTPTEKWCISITGEVRATTQEHRDDYAERANTLQKILPQLPARDIFKNIHSIYINTDNELVFNVHALQLFVKTNEIHLRATQKNQMKAQAQKKDKTSQHFEFADGSTVEINRNGLAILRSSDPLISTIYIPTVLKGELGVATAKEFAGAEYYYKESYCEVILEVEPEKKLMAVKLVKTCTDLPLSDANTFVTDSLTSTKALRMPRIKAEKLRAEMEQIGATVILSSYEGQYDIAHVEPSEFFTKYITSFINTVLNHGA